MAIALVAQEVFVEDPQTPGYPLRWNLAKTVLSPTESQAAAMMVGLVVTPPLLAAAAATGASDAVGMAAAITDEQIVDAIRQGWNAVSGVSPSAVAAEPAHSET
ncbi:MULTISPECIES: hypothetical protein [unclassified Streptomyces]|uniref:hypothetical protein n=1 Tax=unclassified Streptomyces TaxID=2593676 RepID=UPI001EF0004E|nr:MULTISPECIES: hypothetical protein [unclassified Streptomyces]